MLVCGTVGAVPQLLLQFHSPLLHVIQLFLQLTHLSVDVLHRDELVRLHLEVKVNNTLTTGFDTELSKLNWCY